MAFTIEIMKKGTLSLLMFLLFVFVVQAQDFTARYGAKFGINGNTLRNDWDLTKRRAIGAQYGLVAEFAFRDRMTIQPEIFYSNQGMEGFYDTGDVSGRVELNTGYIQVPIMFRYYLTPNISAQVGPQVGFLVKSDAQVGQEFFVDYGRVEVIQGFDTSDLMKTLDVDLNFGISIDLTSFLFVDARYNWGLINTFKPIEGQSVQSKNWIFQFTFGIKIPTF